MVIPNGGVKGEEERSHGLTKCATSVYSEDTSSEVNGSISLLSPCAAPTRTWGRAMAGGTSEDCASAGCVLGDCGS